MNLFMKRVILVILFYDFLYNIFETPSVCICSLLLTVACYTIVIKVFLVVRKFQKTFSTMAIAISMVCNIQEHGSSTSIYAFVPVD